MKIAARKPSVSTRSNIPLEFLHRLLEALYEDPEPGHVRIQYPQFALDVVLEFYLGS